MQGMCIMQASCCELLNGSVNICARIQHLQMHVIGIMLGFRV